MTSRRSWTGLWRVVIVVLALGTVSGTAQAAAPEAAAPACAPSITVLPTFSGPDASLSAVHGLSRTANIAVGSSKGLPAYWTGRTVRRVPLPAGYTAGEVLAVNYFGLMVGWVSRSLYRGPRAFRYWYGASSIVFLPGGNEAVAVNDAGHVVGNEWKNNGPSVGYEWAPGTTVRRTLKLAPNTYLRDVTGINNSGRIIGYGEILESEFSSYSAGLTWSSSVTAAATTLNNPAYPGDIYAVFYPAAIDNRNRIAGSYSYGHAPPVRSPFFWPSPTGAGAVVGGLFDNRDDAAFAALSDNKVAVGTARDSSEGRPPAALIWNGRSMAGPLLELPPLLAGHAAQAFAINNDGRAGGTADDAAGTHPVVWVCALQQARTP